MAYKHVCLYYIDPYIFGVICDQRTKVDIALMLATPAPTENCLIFVLISTHHVGERAANPAQCPLSAAVMHVCLILCLRAYRCKDAAGTGTPVSTAASAARGGLARGKSRVNRC